MDNFFITVAGLSALIIASFLALKKINKPGILRICAVAPLPIAAIITLQVFNSPGFHHIGVPVMITGGALSYFGTVCAWQLAKIRRAYWLLFILNCVILLPYLAALVLFNSSFSFA